jgi:hypothetical protein
METQKEKKTIKKIEVRSEHIKPPYRSPEVKVTIRSNNRK